MDWLTTSTDGSVGSGSTTQSDDPWELDERALSGDVVDDLVDELQPDFLDSAGNASDGLGGDALWTVPVCLTNPDDSGHFPVHARSRPLPTSDARQSGGTSRGDQWAAAHVSTLDIGSLTDPAGFFQRSTSSVSTASGAVDLLRARNVDIRPLRPDATAEPVESLPSMSGANASGARPRAPAPRSSACSRKKRPKRVPSAEAAKCPYCASAVIIDGAVAPELTSQSTTGRFARYRPRMSARKDNRLAAWYVKYGYSGPPYCKGCSESFNSHLLRQNAQVARASCSRAKPCKPCTAILEHFSVEAGEVYRQFDNRKLTRRAKSCKSTGQMKSDVENGKRDNLSTSLVGRKRQKSTASNPEKNVAALTIAAVATIALLSMHRSSTEGTRDVSPSVDLGWTCGEEFSTLMTGTVEAQMEINCAGVDDQAEFLCMVDECHAKGLVPAEKRTCRCDGCVRFGRCVGWQLDGHSPSDASDALWDSCTSTSDRGAANPDDMEQFSWHVPGEMLCSRCSQMCSEHAGCERFECGDKSPLLRMEPDSSQAQPCTLYSAFAWPQPILSSVSLVTMDELYEWNREVPEGVMWTGANGDVWQWVLNPSYWHTANSQLQLMEMSSDGKEDLQYMWRFDPIQRQWRPVQSSLTQRPSPRTGAATWHDSTGSMFLFSGTGCGEFGTDPYGGNTYIPESDPGVPLTLGCMGVANFADMWRYDTANMTWQLLYADPQIINGTRIISRSPSWPRAREGATVWVQEHKNEKRYTAWMFGGAGKGLGAVRSAGEVGGTSELWQFTYSYSESLDRAATEPGKLGPSNNSHPSQVDYGHHWILVTVDLAEAQSPARSDHSGQALYVCSRKHECPRARVEAGSWTDPSDGTAGWVFGGTAWTDDAQFDADLPLFDLWHFNGDAEEPKWRSIERPPVPKTPGTRVADWPPAWVGPTGWTTSVGGGEIWIAGESGVQHEVYTGKNSASPEDSLDVVTDGKQLPSNSMWVFFIAEGRWARVDAPLNFHIETKAQGGATVKDTPVVWPGPRKAAITGDRVMFGGIGSQECIISPGETTVTRTAVGLTGMWTWFDSSSNVHSSGGDDKL